MPNLYQSIALGVLLSFVICANGQTYEVVPASFNSEEADFGGTFYGNGIIYSSSRQRTEITYNEDTVHQYFTDLYTTSIDKEGQWEEPVTLRGEVNTIMNEAQCTFSQDGKTMYYTGNLKNAQNLKNEKSEKYELGILCAKLYNREWVIEDEFPYNSENASYSCGHPFLAQGDSLFLFSSNQPGGYGGSDLYYCRWENNAWSTPKNLGSTINTAGNEFYPFVNEFGTLFFSSDSRDDSEGLDIYCALALENGDYQEPIRLPEPINTDADDFAYSEKKGSNRGCISSNRDGDHDDIYLFTRYEENYNHCLTNAPPFFCYLFSDENYARMSNLPFTYLWRFSDGDSIYGSEVKKCFADFGRYSYALEVRDTLTRQHILTANEDVIEIARPEVPHIYIPPVWSSNAYIQGVVEVPSHLIIDTAKIEWILNDRSLAIGPRLRWKPDTLGEFLLTVRMKTKGSKRISAKPICIEQNIVIQRDSVREEYPPIIPIPLSLPEIVRNNQGQQLIPRYYIALYRSNDSLSCNDSRWASAPNKVMEMTNEKEFIYVIEETADLAELLQKFQTYRDQGHPVQIIQSLTLNSTYKPLREMLSPIISKEESTAGAASNPPSESPGQSPVSTTTKETQQLTVSDVSTEKSKTTSAETDKINQPLQEPQTNSSGTVDLDNATASSSDPQVDMEETITTEQKEWPQHTDATTTEAITLPVDATPNTETDNEDDYTRKVKYVAAVMNIERQMDLQIICEYPSNDKAEHAQNKANQLKELLVQLNVQPDAIAVFTRLNEEVQPKQQVKFLFQYPYIPVENE